MNARVTIQHFQDWGGVASLRYRRPLQNHRSCVLTKALSGMVFAPAQELCGIVLS